MNQTTPDNVIPNDNRTDDPPPPGEQDRCFECGYSLRNLPSWRCPECSYQNSAEESNAMLAFRATSKRIALKCILVPLGYYVAASALMVVAAILALVVGADPHGVMVIAFTLAAPYAVIQCWFNVRGAARLTQLSVIKGPAPAAFSTRPFATVIYFILNFSMLTVVPFIALACVLGILANISLNF